MSNILINKYKKHIVILIGVLVITAVALVSGFRSKIFDLRTISENTFYNQNDEKAHEFYLDLDKHIAEAFGVNLNGYRRITFENLPESKQIKKTSQFEENENNEINLFMTVKMQIPNKNSNTTHSIYINENNTEGIVFTQNFSGIYSFYKLKNKFEIDEDSKFGWTIIETKQVQGEYKDLQKYLSGD